MICGIPMETKQLGVESNRLARTSGTPPEQHRNGATRTIRQAQRERDVLAAGLDDSGRARRHCGGRSGGCQPMISALHQRITDPLYSWTNYSK